MSPSKLKIHFRTLFWFLGINILVSIGFNYSYLIFISVPQKLWSLVFLHSALGSNVLMIYCLIAIPLFLFWIIIKHRIPLFIFSVIIMSGMQIINFIDIAIYRIFKFHLNSMVINLISTEGVGDSLHLGIYTLATIGIIIVSIFIIEAILIHKVYYNLAQKPISKHFITLIIIISLLLISIDKFTFAVADLYNNNDVTRFNKVFPLYQPLTIKRFMRKQFNFKVNREDIISLDKKYSRLNYPKKPLTKPKPGKHLNIVWIVIDAWRYDMLSEEITPRIWDFSKRSIVFQNHYSGGNASRFGIFTMFYGIHGYYWHQFLGERQSPVFINQLKELNYDFKIISSSNLANPEFRKTAFIEIPDHIIDGLNGNRAATKDPLLTTAFSSFLEMRDTNNPFFAFLYYDAPHGPYSYPDNFNKYLPSNKNPNYLTVSKKDSLTLLNSYKNAINFDDFEVGKIIASMEENNILDSTIVVITGDHGEEFYETGHWGHMNNFSDFQTKTPLLIYIPNSTKKNINHLTSHIDLVPTMLELLGYTEDISVFSQGKSLFDKNGHDFIVVSGWDDYAIIYPNTVIEFSSESYNLASWEVRDSNYQLIENERNVIKQYLPDIMEVAVDFSEYLK